MFKNSNKMSIFAQRVKNGKNRTRIIQNISDT